MPGMAFGRVCSPENHHVRSILDFAERRCGFASQLGGYFRGAVSKRGVAVDGASQALRERHRGALGFTRHVAETINQRIFGSPKEIRSRIYTRFKRRRQAVDYRFGVVGFSRMAGEPGRPKATGVPGFDDAVSFNVKLDIVAGTAAKSADDVGDYIHRSFLLLIACRIIFCPHGARL